LLRLTRPKAYIKVEQSWKGKKRITSKP